MDMDRGFKLTRAGDDFNDFFSDFRIAKDPVFSSRETDILFILTAHLKGYKRENLKIDINEDNSLIAITGEKQVIETLTMGQKVVKRDKDIKGFKKVFKIPDGVFFGKINAKFNEDDSILTISMLKKAKGIRGISIEEVKEIEYVAKQGPGNLQITDEKIQKPGEKPETGELFTEYTEKVDDDLRNGEKWVHEKRADCDEAKEHDRVFENANKTHEEKGRGKRCKMCTPIVAGSAVVLVSFVVFVVHIIRSKNQTKRKKD